MPQVSKYPISTKVYDRIFNVFVKSLAGVKTTAEAADFVGDLLTPTERVMLAKRIAIAFLLLKNYEYREISKILRVSLGTIASVKLSLRHGKGSYQRILERIMREENLEEFFKQSVEKLLSVPALSAKGGGSFKYLRDEIKKSKKKTTGIL